MLLAMFFLMTLATSSNEAEVRQLLENREKAWEKQDLVGLVASFSEDSDYLDSTGVITTGRAAIEARYREIFASARYKNSRSIQKIIKIRFIRYDTAVVWAEWTLSGLRSSDDLPLPDRKGISTLVIVKKENDWKIASLHSAVVQDEIKN